MTLSEDEAKTKWCPHVRYGLNRTNVRAADENNCIGSGCMMWRQVWSDQHQRFTDQGYCGLARG